MKTPILSLSFCDSDPQKANRYCLVVLECSQYSFVSRFEIFFFECACLPLELQSASCVSLKVCARFYIPKLSPSFVFLFI